MLFSKQIIPLMKIFVWSILLLSQILFSQESPILIDKSIESIENSFAESLLYAKEDNTGKLFVVQKIFKNSSTPKGYYIKRFSENMVLEDRVKIDLESNEIRGMFINETNVFLIQFEYSREEKVYNINLLSSKKNSFSFKKSTLFTINRQDIDKYDKFGIREKSFFPKDEDFNPGGVLVSSENGKFYCYSLRLKRKKSAKNLFLVFDENLKLINSNIFEEKIKGNVLVTKVAITNNGIIYFLNRKYDKDIPVSKISTTVDNYAIRLHCLNKGKYNEVNFNRDEFNGGSAFIDSSNDKIFIYGYFSEKKSTMFYLAGFSGIFKSEINPKTQEIIHFQKYYFKNLLNNKRGKPVEEIGRQLALKNAFVENGTLVFNSEDHYTDGNNGACMHYGNILSAKFNSTGELTWFKTINKDQTACWGWGKTVKYSFINLYKSDKIYYITNYDIENNEDIDNNHSFCNVITINTSETNQTQSTFPIKIASEIHFKNYINLNNQSVLTEGIDFSGKQILLKVSLKN